MNAPQNFEQLVESHGGEIFAYLWRLLRDVPDTEDSFQETFLRAFRAYHRLAEGSNQRAWLYKIATNVAITHRKRRYRQLAQITTLDPNFPGHGASLSDTAEQNEMVAQVLQAVEALPDKQRVALLMRKYQGLSYGEIGEALGCSESAARANVYQGLNKLREQFRDEQETDR